VTRRDLLAHLLREAGDRGLTTSELLQAGIGARYSARLLELRERGWVVEVTRIRDGAHRYTLVSEPTSRAAPGIAPRPGVALGTGSLFGEDVGQAGPRNAIWDAA